MINLIIMSHSIVKNHFMMKICFGFNIIPFWVLMHHTSGKISQQGMNPEKPSKGYPLPKKKTRKFVSPIVCTKTPLCRKHFDVTGNLTIFSYAISKLIDKIVSFPFNIFLIKRQTWRSSKLNGSHILHYIFNQKSFWNKTTRWRFMVSYTTSQ